MHLFNTGMCSSTTEKEEKMISPFLVELSHRERGFANQKEKVWGFLGKEIAIWAAAGGKKKK